MSGEVRDKIKALEARRKGMQADFDVMRPVFEAVRAEMSPTKGRFEAGENRRSASYNRSIIDSAPLTARRTLVAGLAGGVTSPSRPWLNLQFADPAASEDHEGAAWLHAVEPGTTSAPSC